MGVEVSARRGSSDLLKILSGTSQNVLGIGIAAAATLAAQVLISRTLGTSGFGVVTVVTQAAFVASFATRAGMDMAVLRTVAVDAGSESYDRIRGRVARAAQVAFLASVVVALAAIAGADEIRRVFSLDPQGSRYSVEAAAVALPFVALTNVWLAATRGLKMMRYTLYVFWAGQPLLWIALMVFAWRASPSEWATVAAYSASWAAAAAAAWWCWRRESRTWPAEAPDAGEMKALFRYAGPRAPAALFSQLLFWTDLFVLTRYVSDADVGVYSAALRAGQVVVLFLTSVNLMFSPYVADLHNRGEIRRLDTLFKSLTRWTLAATLPAFLLIAVAPEDVLRIFGSGFGGGGAALLILLAGQLVNIATGSAGFVLIMAGRTGWDLAVYLGALTLDLALAFALCPRYGIEGAAMANAVTFATANTVRLALVKRLVGIQPYDRSYLRLIAPAAAAAAAMLAVQPADRGTLGVVLTGLTGLGAYTAVYLLAGLTPPERAAARRLLRR
jgi:O-antigen/teichoic acid export membrane protein